MTLKDQGYRFVFRAGKYKWIHHNEVRATDVDCTDMSDEQFAAMVGITEGKQQ